MKKIISLLLVVALVLSIMPLYAFAIIPTYDFSADITSISYTPRENPIVIYYECGGEVRTDESSADYYHYSPLKRFSDDILTVNYNDGRGAVDYKLVYDPEPRYVSTTNQNDVIDEKDVEMFDEQWQVGKHFTMGDNNFIYVSYMGKTCSVRVRVEENPVSAIVYTPAGESGNIEITKETGGEWRDHDGDWVYEYNTPWFNDGDTLAVTYSQSGNTVEYTYYDRFIEEKNDHFNGFFDNEFNELPNSDKLNTVREGDWESDADKTMYVEYLDNRSNDVTVKIVPNPVKSIFFERDGELSIIEGTDMYHDWDGNDYYNLNSRQGDILTVYDNENNPTIYVFNQEERVYKCDGKPDITEEDVRFNSDQRENPWGVGNHDYSVEYMGREFVLTLQITENPVKAITFERAEFSTLVEGTDMNHDWDGNDYYNLNSRQGDILTVYDNENNPTIYVFNQKERVYKCDGKPDITEEDVRFNSDQRENPWGVGNHDYSVEYMGREFVLTLQITESPIKSIRFNLKTTPVIMVGVRSYIDEHGNEMFELPEFSVGDEFIVTDKNDVETVYTAAYDESHDLTFFAEGKDPIRARDLNTYDHQSDNPWKEGGNEFYVQYMGKECAVNCTVLPNPVKSISYIQVNPTVYRSGTHMYHDEDNADYYECPRVEEGDKLTVTYYSDPENPVEYTAKYDPATNRVVFEADPENVIRVDDNRLFEYYHEQSKTPWVVGTDNFAYVSYCGKVAVIPVEIKENNTVKIEIIPKVMPQIYEPYYHTETAQDGHEYKEYAIPEFKEGDILRFIDNNNIPTDYVLTHCEDDEDYFVYGDERIHKYELHCYSNQDEVEWEVGSDNYFTVELFGLTAQVEVKMLPTNVKSVEYKKQNPIVVNENTTGEFRWDNFDNQFYFYNPDIVDLGDEIVVTYLDNSVVEYVISYDEVNHEFYAPSKTDETDRLNQNDISVDDKQYDFHWEAGKENYFYVVYRGIETRVPVFINKPGDINGDGKVNNKDLLRLLKYLSKWDVAVNQYALDVNGDSTVNNKDLIRLLKYMSGWDVKIY